MKNGEIQQLILTKLNTIESELKEVRQTDIPNIKTDVAVIKTEASTAAKVIAAVGGIVAVVVSTAIAYLK